MRTPRGFRRLVALGLVMFLVAACGQSADPGATTTTAAAGSSTTSSGGDDSPYDPEGTFKVALGSDPGAVSPYLTTIGTARHVFSFGYDTLVKNDDNGEPISNIAASWDVQPDSVTFTIKEGVACHDGSLLKASDVAANFEYMKHPDTASPWRPLTVPAEYSVEADDDARTFTITTEEPFSMLLQGAGSLAIVCPAALEDPEAANHQFLGTGPYTVKDYVSGSHYELEKRDDYTWGPGGATTELMPRTVFIYFTANESTAANQLLAGEINAAQILGPDRSRLDAAGMDKALIDAQFAQLGFNQAEGRILSDVKVRQALAAGFDRAAAAAVATDGTGTVSTSLFVAKPTVCQGEDITDAIPAYNPEEAGRLLDEAGWTLGSDGIRAKDGTRLSLKAVFMSGNAPAAATMEYLESEWRKIGVEVELVGTTSTAYQEIMYSTLEFDINYSSMNVELPFMLPPFYSGPNPQEGGRNSGSIDNPEYVRLTEEALEAPNKGCDKWTEASRSLAANVNVLPIADGVRPFYYRGGELDTYFVWTVPTSYRVLKAD